MKKKLLVLNLLMAMSLGLGGCTEKITPTQDLTVETKNTEKEIETKEKSEPVNLVWYQFVDKVMPDQDKVMKEINKYLEEKINVTVTANIMSLDDYLQKMPVIISSGQEFDVCFSTSWMVNYNEYVAKKAFLPIDDLLESQGKETKDFIPKEYWEALKIDGQIYGVPGYKEAGYQYGILYNQDMADEIGVDMHSVKEFADMESILKAVKEAKPEVLPIAGELDRPVFSQEHISGDWMLPGVMNVPGMEVYEGIESGKIINQYETKEYMEFAQMTRRWYEAGYTPKDPANYTTTHEDMKSNKLFAYTIYYAPGCETAFEAQYGCKVGYIPMYNPILETASVNGGAIHCISQSSKNPEKAMEFINLLYTDEKLGTMIRHGIEGEHYTVEGNQIKMIADPANPVYDYGSGWQLGTIFNQKWTTNYDSNVEEVYLDYNDKLVATKGLGFSFNQQNVANEIASLNNVIKEFLIPINGGVVDPNEYIPRFNEKLKANGLDRYLEELQTQYDKWVSSK